MGRPRLTCANCGNGECEVGQVVRTVPLGIIESLGVSCLKHSKKAKKADPATVTMEVVKDAEGKTEEHDGNTDQVPRL